MCHKCGKLGHIARVCKLVEEAKQPKLVEKAKRLGAQER